MRLILIATALTMAICATQPADAENAKKKPKKVDPAAPSVQDSAASPRMIEIRPGTWVSSWGCVMDDGKHGLMPCSGGGEIN